MESKYAQWEIWIIDIGPEPIDQPIIQNGDVSKIRIYRACHRSTFPSQLWDQTTNDYSIPSTSIAIYRDTLDWRDLRQQLPFRLFTIVSTFIDENCSYEHVCKHKTFNTVQSETISFCYYSCNAIGCFYDAQNYFESRGSKLENPFHKLHLNIVCTSKFSVQTSAITFLRSNYLQFSILDLYNDFPIKIRLYRSTYFEIIPNSNTKLTRVHKLNDRCTIQTLVDN